MFRPFLTLIAEWLISGVLKASEVRHVLDPRWHCSTKRLSAKRGGQCYDSIAFINRSEYGNLPGAAVTEGADRDCRLSSDMEVIAGN